MKLDEIRNHSDLDSAEGLPKGHEKRFEKRLEEAFGNRQTSIPWLKIAALFILAFGLSALGTYVWDDEENIQVDAVESEFKGIPIQEATFYYAQSIDKKVKLVNQANNSPETAKIITESEKAIAELDSVYLVLQKQLEETGDQRVAAAMINNYKNRIQVLETLIQKITYVNHLKKENNENKAS